MMRCRWCQHPLERPVVDLGVTPLANAYVAQQALGRPETYYPLKVMVCERCLLVQIEHALEPEALFSEYAYFSSISSSWVEHARAFAHERIAAQRLGPGSLVVEIASNDGYLLRHFVERGVPVCGVEPAANIARAAQEAGIRTENRFFGEETARDMAARGLVGDLVVANNVLAHVPDIGGFVRGLAQVVKPGGLVSVEFPHLYELVRESQIDTIYHEHIWYYSLCALAPVFAECGLTVVDVKRLPTHGGSLRVLACRNGAAHPLSGAVAELVALERAAGLADPARLAGLEERARAVKRGLLAFLLRAREEGKRVVAYGAPAKGNTLLNYCGIREDLIDFTVDKSPHKQGHYLPGSRLAIHAPARIDEVKPDYVLLLPWNLKAEITEEMARVRAWGGRFVVPIPAIEVV